MDCSGDIELEALRARLAETERTMQRIVGHLARRDEVLVSITDELASETFKIAQNTLSKTIEVKNFHNDENINYVTDDRLLEFDSDVLAR